ncbi:AbrB/MazE/SpoVT family DNA-binding domain-containing protein [Streptosporangium jomthongense]|uniref:AbrB/MazE/SpoVT family DNA-binding domain-containing protein n=1 Tax=Streptosporangium jomthongense TaxID=1193683 RepID=A0ABV8FG68_9ACTN
MSRTTLRRKGQLTLPSEVRSALHIDDGDEVEFEIVEPGVVVMRGLKMIPADQAWFWSESWQAGEHEASNEISIGRTTVHKTADDMFDHLGG